VNPADLHFRVEHEIRHRPWMTLASPILVQDVKDWDAELAGLEREFLSHRLAESPYRSLSAENKARGASITIHVGVRHLATFLEWVRRLNLVLARSLKVAAGRVAETFLVVNLNTAATYTAFQIKLQFRNPQQHLAVLQAALQSLMEIPV
jgi:hypothetical protein